MNTVLPKLVTRKVELTVVSENNNGIHSKDDLQVKNLTLLVACIDNSLKGNDGVEIEGGTATIKMPTSISAYVIVLVDNSPSITTESSVSVTLDENGVAWN